MIIPFEYRTREDGVKLIRRLDVKVDENSEPLLDTENQPIPTGYKIRKIGTDEIYDEAIDIEGASYTYEETDEPIEVIED